jgi:hypothetical protein
MLVGKVGMLVHKLVGMLVHQLGTSVHQLSCYLDTAWYHMLQEVCYKRCVTRGEFEQGDKKRPRGYQR